MSNYYAALELGLFTVLVCLFQSALAAGVPWGNMAIAGRTHNRFCDTPA
jgi:hypothetical protein